MKRIILLAALFAFGAHAETKSEMCAIYAKTVQNIAVARDNATPMGQVINIINQSKVSDQDKELLSKVTVVIYNAPSYIKEDVYRDSFSVCINGNSRGL